MSSDRDQLLGRREETERLTAALDAACAGHGRLLLLAGEAGVGKSRLADDVLSACALDVRVGRAREELSTPYGPILMALREHLRRTPGGADGFGPLARYLAMLLPELGPAPDDVGSEVLVEALVGAWTAIARHRPTVLFIEDLHWADDATIELLPVLAERIGAEPLLVLATYRSDDIPRGHAVRRLRTELRRGRLLEEVTIGPMDRDETTRLLAHALGDTPSPDLATLVYDKTQGVPLYVEELAGALLSSRRVERSSDGVRIVDGSEVPIPEGITDAVILRLHVLSEAARGHLEIAAVAGIEFDLEMITALAGEEAGIEELLDARLITETDAGSGAFRHALIREAILEQIAWSNRRSLNRRIAAYLEREGAPPELVAEHWLAAHEHEPARRALLDVADRSCRLHAYRDAARAGHRALEIWPDGVDETARLDALMRLAHCAQVTGQLRDAVRALREVIDRSQVSGAGTHRANALRALATVHGLEGSWDLALETRIQAARAYEAIGAGDEAAVEWLAVAGRHTGQSLLDSALDAVRRAGELAGSASRIDLVVRAKGFEGNLLAMQGDAATGRGLAQEALSLALGSNLSGAAAEAYRRLASVLDYSSDFAGSRDAYDAAVSYCRDQGDDVNACVCLGCMSFIVYRTGEWKRALEVCREVINDPVSTPGSAVVAHAVLGLIRMARGEMRPARKSLNEARTIARGAQLTFVEIFPDFGLALLAELEGNDDEAMRLHQRVIDGWRETQDRHDLVPVFLWQSTYFGRRGREHEATQRAEALATMAAGTGNPETMGALAHALGEISLLGGDTAEASRQLGQALALLETLDIPLEVAVTSWRLGSALAAHGDREGAVRHLTNAVRTTRNMGARAVAALIAAELEALGAGDAAGARGDGSGATAGHVADPTVTLTARQREIVRLISDGLTNKEIAAKLFVSPRTVDMHVSRILDRLDCRTRTEAARKAAALGLE